MNELGTPQVGDIWQEQDPRHPRFVRVERVGTGRCSIGIVTVAESAKGWLQVPRSRFSYADVQRFNGKRGGYKLHQRDWVTYA